MHRKCLPRLHRKELTRRSCANCNRLRARDQYRKAQNTRLPTHPFVKHFHCRACSNEYHRLNAHNRYVQALKMIAHRWSDGAPRCRKDTLPVEHLLRNCPCYGPLQIDHMNGGGSKERQHGAFVNSIVTGERSLLDLRILCLLHQLWNRGYGPAKV